LRAHAFTLGILQETFLTETADDALHHAWSSESRICAIWYARGAAMGEFGIGAAFLFRKSRDGNSEPEGGNAEQQRESKARVHR